MSTKPPARAAFTLIELLVVLCVITILIGLLAPAVQAARKAARRSQCANNMKQAALALLEFHNAKGYFPPTGQTLPATSKQGAPLEGMGWVTAALPYFDSQPIANKYDPTQTWSSSAVGSSAYVLPNVDITANRLNFLECPMAPYAPTHLDGDPRAATWTASAAPTDYGTITQVEARLAAYQDATGAAIVDGAGPGIMPLGQPRPTIDQVKDGLTNTILLAECGGRPQLYRRNLAPVGEAPTTMVNGGGWCRPASDFGLDGASLDGESLPGPCAINCTNGENIGGQSYPYPFYGVNGSGEIYSFHRGGANIAFADGSVNFVREDIDIRVIARMVTRAGDEIVARSDLD
jgi:prepilin-type processing-associated H-X9-DG protein/prepilin-type N-terminal cleavage/methylation domain-containing protein